MSTVDRNRILESAATGDRISEAVAPLGTSPIAADGTVTVHIMRPCAGMGVGRHIYEAQMLEREAPKFKGWPMYIDHESPREVKDKAGLPPSLLKLGGEVLESWWDPSVPAEGRFQQGAVVGKVMPSPWMEPVIQRFPSLVGVSMNTHAVGTTPRRTQEGTRYVVEGFIDEGSIDWVSKAGAGGKIVPVMEAWFDADENEEPLATWLREHRPAVVESLIKPKPTHGDEEDENVKPVQVIEAFDAMSDDDREKVAESVLDSDAGKATIATAVDARLTEVLPKAMEAAATAVETQALAAVDAKLGQGDLKTAAQARLQEAALADAFREDAWARISEQEFKAVDADDKGEGGKTARQVMEGMVDAEITRVTALQEAAGIKPETVKPRRTAVSGNGGGEEEIQEATRVQDDRTGDWRQVLEGAGIQNAPAAYGVPAEEKPEDKPTEGEDGK